MLNYVKLKFRAKFFLLFDEENYFFFDRWHRFRLLAKQKLTLPSFQFLEKNILW